MSLESFLINSKEILQKSLGLLPTYFLIDSESQFVMQNGNINNFCIDFNNKFSPESYRHYSWVSDTNCFINVMVDKIELYRWDKLDKPEIINTNNFTSGQSALNMGTMYTRTTDNNFPSIVGPNKTALLQPNKLVCRGIPLF